MNIYHGSKDIIKQPEYGKGKPHNDYGLGFYCTEDIEMAKESINNFLVQHQEDALKKVGDFSNLNEEFQIDSYS